MHPAMKTCPRASVRLARAFSLATVFTGFSSGALIAADGAWNVSASGDWGDITKWNAGAGPVADGVGAIANFNVLANQSITLDADRTVGRLNFTNSANMLSSANGSVLTLAAAGGTPVIDGSATISATLAGTQGLSFQPGGFRDLKLSGNNTYTGVTSVASGGKLYVLSSNALGAAGPGNGTSLTYADNANVQLVFNSSAGPLVVREDVLMRMTASGGGDGAVTGRYLIVNENAANSTTLQGTLTLDRASTTSNGRAVTDYFGVQAVGTLNLEGAITGAASAGQTTSTSFDPTRLQINATTATANVNIGGEISDGAITVGGVSVYTALTSLGVVRLSGENTYTGSTVHQKGTLLVNNTAGSGTGVGAVSVAATATFGGTGIVAPSGSNGVTFAAGSIVAPGDVDSSGDSIAAGKTLTFDLSNTTGTVDFQAGAAISIDLNGDSATVAESFAFIGLDEGVAGVLFNGNTVNFSVGGAALADGLYTLATFDAANAYSGGWVIGAGLEDYADRNLQLIFNADSIQLQIGTGAIPEPASAVALGAFVALGFAAVGRRRRG